MQPKGLLRASVLLKGDDLRRFKDFQYWRSFGNPAVLDIADEYMTLPTAYEYYEFRSQHFDIHQAKNTGVAAQCRHPLHPGHPAVQPQQPEAEAGRDKRSPTEVAQWCPVCTVRMHLGLLDALFKQWKAVGGPWRDADSPPRTPARQEVMRAYTVRKTDFANELLRVEDISHLEQKWETANSSTTPQRRSSTDIQRHTCPRYIQHDTKVPRYGNFPRINLAHHSPPPLPKAITKKEDPLILPRRTTRNTQPPLRLLLPHLPSSLRPELSPMPVPWQTAGQKHPSKTTLITTSANADSSSATVTHRQMKKNKSHTANCTTKPPKIFSLRWWKSGWRIWRVKLRNFIGLRI
ncbi:hypothetical protein A1F94_009670 [Pyrenophora tritici-repentis]|nr:hypothetical protein A1F94_009670 [Pyrenophora tritici-repentis]